MASRAGVDIHCFRGRPRIDHIAASAANRRVTIIWVDILLHKTKPFRERNAQFSVFRTHPARGKFFYSGFRLPASVSSRNELLPDGRAMW